MMNRQIFDQSESPAGGKDFASARTFLSPAAVEWARTLANSNAIFESRLAADKNVRAPAKASLHSAILGVTERFKICAASVADLRRSTFENSVLKMNRFLVFTFHRSIRTGSLAFDTPFSLNASMAKL